MENKEDLLNLGNNKNPKKILIYGAAAFLVFVIGVILFALFGGNSNKEDNAIIPPQVKEEPLFKEIPIEEKNNQVEEENNKENKENIKQIPIKKPINNTDVKATPKKEVKEEKVVKQFVPKKEIKKDIPKKIEPVKPVKKKSLVKYYVQVAALMKYAKPNKKFLELLKKYGYNYIIYPVVVEKNGKKIKVNKLLVGPFDSKEKAKKELIKIKRHITQNAFIFKVSK